MTPREKWLTFAVSVVVLVEVVRHFTWRDSAASASAPFQPNGMQAYAAVKRRA